jgi:hypothetical protein
MMSFFGFIGNFLKEFWLKMFLLFWEKVLFNILGVERDFKIVPFFP